MLYLRVFDFANSDSVRLFLVYPHSTPPKNIPAREEAGLGRPAWKICPGVSPRPRDRYAFCYFTFFPTRMVTVPVSCPPLPSETAYVILTIPLKSRDGVKRKVPFSTRTDPLS